MHIGGPPGPEYPDQREVHEKVAQLGGLKRMFASQKTMNSATIQNPISWSQAANSARTARRSASALRFYAISDSNLTLRCVPIFRYSILPSYSQNGAE